MAGVPTSAFGQLKRDRIYTTFICERYVYAGYIEEIEKDCIRLSDARWIAETGRPDVQKWHNSIDFKKLRANIYPELPDEYLGTWVIMRHNIESCGPFKYDP